MKTILVITAIVLAAVFSAICRAHAVAEKEAEILKLMEPGLARMQPGLIHYPADPWFTFARQQHDDLTLVALLNLSKTASDEKVRYLALGSLSRQKNVRLIPFWQGILENRDDVDDCPSAYAYAISGLSTINTPQSTRVLLTLLSDPETPPTILCLICGVHRRSQEIEVSEEIWEQIFLLTTHESPKVRLTALKALPYYLETSFFTKALRDQLLHRALTDTNLDIVRWGLRSLGMNAPPELFSITLDYLNHKNASVRALADEALIYFLFEHFEMCQIALEEKRWTYQTAPLLTSRYARILETEKGEFAEAEKAYQTAQRTYASNDAYHVRNDDPGATMLYRLIQVKQKCGDIEGAITVLNRIVKEYSRNTRIYANDFPAPGHNIIGTVGELESQFRVILEDAPIRIRVSPLNETYHPKEDLKFKVSIHNLSTEKVMLHCKHQKGKDVLVPDRPIIVINGNQWTNFHETTFLVDTVKKVAIPPNESYSFVGTLGFSRTGNYVIDFRFKPVCELEDGTQWSARILSNSVKIKMP